MPTQRSNCDDDDAPDTATWTQWKNNLAPSARGNYTRTLAAEERETPSYLWQKFSCQLLKQHRFCVSTAAASAFSVGSSSALSLFLGASTSVADRDLVATHVLSMSRHKGVRSGAQTEMATAAAATQRPAADRQK